MNKLEAVRWRINTLLWGTDMLATRFTLATAAIITGITIAINPEFWPDILIAPYIAALLFLIQGLVMSTTLLVGGRKNTSIMYIDGVLGCLLWSFICVTNLSYDPWHYSDAAHIAIALASWWSLVRWGDAADAD